MKKLAVIFALVSVWFIYDNSHKSMITYCTEKKPVISSAGVITFTTPYTISSNGTVISVSYPGGIRSLKDSWETYQPAPGENISSCPQQ